MVGLLLNPLFETSCLRGGKSWNAFISAVKWANVDCDLTWFMVSNVVHSTCTQKATHLLI